MTVLHDMQRGGCGTNKTVENRQVLVSSHSLSYPKSSHEMFEQMNTTRTGSAINTGHSCPGVLWVINSVDSPLTRFTISLLVLIILFLY